MRTVAYDRILRAVADQPWAILESKLLEIEAVLAFRAAGGLLSDEELQAKIGAGRQAPAQRQASGGVAVIPVFGVIAHRMNLMTEMSGGTSTEKLGALIGALAADPNVSAIVLDVDSPGGGVFGLPELAATIRDARRDKPVIAVANALAASAAYWLAAQATEVVITPSGQIGSIGVFAVHENHAKRLEKEGVEVSIIKAGARKAENAPFGPLSDEARADMQAKADAFHEMFLRDVAKGRGQSYATVKSYGDGRVFGAKEAKALGMVDRVATLDAVLSDLVTKGPSAYAASLPTRDLVAEDDAPALEAATVGGDAPTLLASGEAVLTADQQRELAASIAQEPAPAAEMTADDRAELEQRRRRLRLLALGA